jgi:hypothetical protein
MMTKDDIFSRGEEVIKRQKSAKVFLEKQAERKQYIWRKVSLGKTSDSVRPCLLAWVEVEVRHEMCRSHFTV